MTSSLAVFGSTITFRMSGAANVGKCGSAENVAVVPFDVNVIIVPPGTDDRSLSRRMPIHAPFCGSAEGLRVVDRPVDRVVVLRHAAVAAPVVERACEAGPKVVPGD